MIEYLNEMLSSMEERLKQAESDLEAISRDTREQTTNEKWDGIARRISVNGRDGYYFDADGQIKANITAKATAGTVFLTEDSGVIKSRTAAELLSDIGGGGLSGSGTSGTIAKFTASDTLGDSGLVETATAFGIYRTPKAWDKTSYYATHFCGLGALYGTDSAAYNGYSYWTHNLYDTNADDWTYIVNDYACYLKMQGTTLTFTTFYSGLADAAASGEYDRMLINNHGVFVHNAGMRISQTNDTTNPGDGALWVEDSLRVEGNVRFDGTITFTALSPASGSSTFLVLDTGQNVRSETVQSVIVENDLAIIGQGTADYLAKFIGDGSISDSIVQETDYGIGVNRTPAAWDNSSYIATHFCGLGAMYGHNAASATNSSYWTHNLYETTADGWTYIASDYACFLRMSSRTLSFRNFDTGTADTAATGITTRFEVNHNGLFVQNGGCRVSSGTTTTDPGDGNLHVEGTGYFGGVLTLAGVAASTDNTVLCLNGSNEVIQDEIDSRVWGSSLLDATGTPADNQIAVFTDANTLEGTANLTWDGTLFDIATGFDFEYDSGNDYGIIGIDSSGYSRLQVETAHYNGTRAVRFELYTLGGETTGSMNLKLTDPGSGTFLISSASGVTTMTCSGSYLRINDNVGINKAPSTMLDVNGTGYFGGDLELDGALDHDGSTVGFYAATPVVQASHISDPSGGGTQDSEARTAINSILVVLENLGLTATS